MTLILSYREKKTSECVSLQHEILYTCSFLDCWHCLTTKDTFLLIAKSNTLVLHFNQVRTKKKNQYSQLPYQNRGYLNITIHLATSSVKNTTHLNSSDQNSCAVTNVCNAGLAAAPSCSLPAPVSTALPLPLSLLFDPVSVS